MWTALYARVSTDEQAQQGYSIESQKERLKAYCLSQGYTQYEFYIDDGYTGTKLDRPAMNRLLADIQAHLVHSVVVYRLDRLGRRQKDVLYLLEDVFEPFGVTFKSATEPFDTSTPFGRAMLGVLAVFAQLERDTIVERTSLGRQQRIRAGKWPGGRVPFGYTWLADSESLQPRPDQAVIIQEIYAKFLQGQTLSEISRWVSHRSADRKWTHSAIRDLLMRPLYAGFVVTRAGKVKGLHEAIIEPRLWELAQLEFSRRKKGTTARGAYLLSGLLECGICGGPVIHFPYRIRQNGHVYTYEYYGCQAQHSREKGQHSSCTLGFRRQEALEAQVTEQLFQLTFPEEAIQRELEALTRPSASRELVIQITSRLQAVKAKRSRWFSAFEEGIISADQLATYLSPLEAEQKALEQQLSDQEMPDRTRRPVPILPSLLLQAAWPHMNPAERRTILHLAIKKIILYKGSDLHIDWNVAD